MEITLYIRRTERIDIRHHFVQEDLRDNIVKLEYVSINNNLVDVFTKLGNSKHVLLRNKASLTYHYFLYNTYILDIL